MVQLLDQDMGFEMDQIEACQLALASSNSPLTLQAATERWFVCLILTSFGGLAFLLIHVSCPFSQLFLLLSVMFLRVGFVVFSVSCLPLKNYADNLSPFCLLFLLFSRLLSSPDLPHCCPKLILTRWKGGTRLRWFTDKGEIQKIGENVTPEAQKLFNTISKCEPHICPQALIDYCPHVYSIPHSEPGFEWFVSRFVGVMFVQHLVAWKRGCWRSKHKNASLISFAEEERQICRAIAGGRDESCLWRLYSRHVRDNTATEQFAFQVAWLE